MTQNAEMARYYGNLRFAMFAVFTAIVGALILLPFDKDRAALMLIEPQKYFFAISGIILSLGFFLLERRNAQLISFYQDVSFKSKVFSEPPRHKVWKILVPIIMCLPYLLSILFWGLFLSGYIALNPTSH